MRNGFRAPRLWLFLACLLAVPAGTYGLGQKRYVETTRHSGDFVLARPNGAAALYVDSGDYPGVIRAVGDLQADIARVASIKPAIAHFRAGLSQSCVLIGTLGKSALI